MQRTNRGFTLVELITVMILIGIISVTLFSRLGSIASSRVQAGRDDLIAALFFAQQTAMARSGVQCIIASNSLSVKENGANAKGYPLALPTGVTATAANLSYDKLGRTTATSIVLTGTDGSSATVKVEATGYAH